MILTYHRVLPDGHPDLPIMQPGMVVAPDTFRMHLQWLRQNFDIVKLDEWVRESSRGHSGERSRRACAITFDDGWRDTFQYAFPILREEQVPATIFLVSDMVGTARSFWPERLARLLWNNGGGPSTEICAAREYDWLHRLGVSELVNGAAPDRHVLDRVIRGAQRCSDDWLEEKIGLLEEAACAKDPTRRDILDWDEVNALARSGLFGIGSHGRNHIRLNDDLATKRIENEILGSKALLESRVGCRVELFCYPNGDFTSEGERLVHDRYLAACTTRRGWNWPTTDKYRLKRISIHEDMTRHRSAFLAKLSGFL